MVYLTRPLGNTNQKSATASLSYLILVEKHRSTTSGPKITLIPSTKVTANNISVKKRYKKMVQMYNKTFVSYQI